MKQKKKKKKKFILINNSILFNFVWNQFQFIFWEISVNWKITISRFSNKRIYYDAVILWIRNYNITRLKLRTLLDCVRESLKNIRRSWKEKPVGLTHTVKGFKEPSMSDCSGVMECAWIYVCIRKLSHWYIRICPF